MSLSLDKIFLAAIKADQDITAAVEGRLWCTAAPMPEDAFLENVKLPYVIVMFDGFANTDETKDDPFDGGEDRVNIAVTVAAKNNEELTDLAVKVRKAVHDYLVTHMGEDGMPTACYPGSRAKIYDQYKPCYAIDLTWQCDVLSDIYSD